MTEEQAERLVVAIETIAACTKAQLEEALDQGRLLARRFQEAAAAERAQAETNAASVAASQEMVNASKRATNVMQSELGDLNKLRKR